jgi:Zn-dependent peptidase ImmA (M78 family)
MSTRWETLLGDTSRFAVKMAFIDDASEAVVPRDLAASWGSLEIWVNGANICAHLEEGEVLDAVHWYLLPLLEWITANWNPLFHEERLPVRNAGVDAVESLYLTRFPPTRLPEDRALAHEEEWYGWRERHALHAARDGGLFPEVYLRRREDRVELSWSNRTPPGSPGGFAFMVPHGRALLDPREVAQPLFGVMRAAAEQLVAWQPESERFRALLSSILELSKPRKQRSSRLDWLFGLRFAARAGDSWEAVQGLFAGATAKVRRAVLEPDGSGLVLHGSSHAALLFGSVAPTIDESDARLLAQYLIDLFDESGDSEPLAQLVELASSDEFDGLPWEQGYDLAGQVREAIAARDPGRITIDETTSDLGLTVDTIELTDPRIRGVAVAGPRHRPAILVNSAHPRNQSEEGTRFTLAHELCHLIVDRSIGRKLAVASGPWAPIEIEQRANAFAAYFLMPPEDVQEVVAALSEPLDSREGVRAVAREFGTSARATLEHLHNLGWLDEFQRDMMRGTGIDDESFGRLPSEIGG